tara:strand:- start:37 stop:237 length:201 start_codon:yes stop_codon:yes gene_type:complete
MGVSSSLKWFRCKGRDTTIYKPKGKVIKFWIGGTDELSVREVLDNKGFKDVEYIKEDKEFPNNLNE